MYNEFKGNRFSLFRLFLFRVTIFKRCCNTTSRYAIVELSRTFHFRDGIFAFWARTILHSPILLGVSWFLSWKWLERRNKYPTLPTPPPKKIRVIILFSLDWIGHVGLVLSVLLCLEVYRHLILYVESEIICMIRIYWFEFHFYSHLRLHQIRSNHPRITSLFVFTQNWVSLRNVNVENALKFLLRKGFLFLFFWSCFGRRKSKSCRQMETYINPIYFLNIYYYLLLHEYIYESSRVKKKIVAAFQILLIFFTPKFYDVNFVLRQPAHITRKLMGI